MSVATHLELLTTCNRWARGNAIPDHLLRDTLSYIQDAVAGLSRLSLYHLDGDKFRRNATTDSGSELTRSLDAHPLFKTAIEDAQPVLDTAAPSILIPLPEDGTVLVADFSDSAAMTDAAVDWLRLFAAYLEQALDTRALRDVAQVPTTTKPDLDTGLVDYNEAISERQKLTFNEMVAGQNFAEMANIVVRHMLPEPERYLSINELILDEADEVIGWQSLNNAASGPHTMSLDVKWDDLSPALRIALMDGEALENLRTNEPEDLDKPLHKWLASHNIKTIALFPITVSNRTVAIVATMSEAPDAFSREEINAFSNVTDQMGALTQVRQLLGQARSARYIVDNLALASRLVAIAADHSYMAQAITYTVARNMQAVTIALFDQPITEGITSRTRQIVGVSTPEEIVDYQGGPVPDLPDQAALRRLVGGLPLIFEDIENSYLSPETLDRLRPLNATWMVSFGLRANDRLLGTLDIFHHQPYDLTQEEIDAYTTLADQIGVTIRSRQLLEQSEFAQSMAAQLVDTTRLISVAEDYTEMIQSMMPALPASIEMAGILLFNAPVSVHEMPESLHTEVMVTRDAVLQPGLVDMIPVGSERAEAVINRLLEGEMFFMHDTSVNEDTIVREHIRFLEARGLGSVATIGLRSGARLHGAVVFAARDSTGFTGIQLDNLRAIAGQVAIAIENRYLLDQTSEALSFVAAQYQTSDAIYRAENAEQLLWALHNLSDGAYHLAHLGFVDSDSGEIRVTVAIERSRSVVAEAGQALETYQVPAEVAAMDNYIIVSEDRKALTLPLITSSDELLAVVHFRGDEPDAMPFNRLRALRNLADQMTTTLENRLLLQRTEEALRETSTLYKVNRALLESPDALQMLHVIRGILAQDANSLLLASLEYDRASGRIESYSAHSLVMVDAAQRIKQPLHETMSAEELQAYQAATERQGQQLSFIEDAAVMHEAQPVLTYLAERWLTVESAIILPIFDEDILAQQIFITFEQPQTFSPQTRRLYEALRDQVSIILQNQRLLRDVSNSAAQLGNQVRVLQTLNQLASNLNAAHTEKDLMDDAAQALVNALRVDHVGITLLHPDGVSAEVISEYPAVNLVGTRISADNPLQQRSIREHGPIVIANIEAEPNLPQSFRERVREAGIQSMLILPMLDIHEQYVGSIGLDVFREDFTFTPDMIDVARTITAQVSVSLQSIRQMNNTQRQARQLQQLANFSQIVQAQMDVGSILETLAREAPDIIPHRHLAVMFSNLDTGALDLVLEVDKGKANRYPTGLPIKIEHTTSGLAWANRTMLSFPDLTTEPELKHAFVDDVKSGISTPIFSRGMPMGLVEIGHVTPYAYNETDQIILQQLVNQIGIAIENAETYTQSQRLAQSKALINEISSQLQQQIDIDSILDVTVSELGRALKARQGRIRLVDRSNLQNNGGTE